MCRSCSSLVHLLLCESVHCYSFVYQSSESWVRIEQLWNLTGDQISHVVHLSRSTFCTSWLQPACSLQGRVSPTFFFPFPLPPFFLIYAGITYKSCHFMIRVTLCFLKRLYEKLVSSQLCERLVLAQSSTICSCLVFHLGIIFLATYLLDISLFVCLLPKEEAQKAP